MSCYPKQDSHIRNKVQVLIDLSNCTTEKELNEAAADVDTSNLAAKSNFIALKTEVDNQHINKLVNVPAGLNNLKTIVDDLYIWKLKSVPVILKK